VDAILSSNLANSAVTAYYHAGLPYFFQYNLTVQRGENGQVLISVSDAGAGLPAQQADQIFNAFFTTKTHGTGMGLRISRSIVESHGGSLWAADNSPRGATFQFTPCQPPRSRRTRDLPSCSQAVPDLRSLYGYPRSSLTWRA